jgi:hypothetical protein
VEALHGGRVFWAGMILGRWGVWTWWWRVDGGSPWVVHIGVPRTIELRTSGQHSAQANRRWLSLLWE